MSNTTSISNQIRIQYLPLLQRIFQPVPIPAQVAEELDRGQHVLGVWQDAPGANALDMQRPLEGPFLPPALPDSQNAKYQEVRIERKNVFNGEALYALMLKASREEEMVHGT